MNDEAETIAQAEHALAKAHLSADRDTIERLLNEDYVIVQPGGGLETKADFLASLQDGHRHWTAAEVDELDIRLYDTCAVVIGRWRASGQNGAVAFAYQARFLSVWVKQDGRWRNVAYQSTEIPADG